MRVADVEIALGFAFIPANKRLGLKLLKAVQEWLLALELAGRFGLTVPEYPDADENGQVRQLLRKLARHFSEVIPEHLRSEEAVRETSVDLHALVATFKEQHFPHFSEDKKDWYARAIKFFIIRQVSWNAASREDRHGAYAAIKAMLNECNVLEKLSSDTRSKYYDYVGAIFDWIVSEEFLDKNPMRALPKPKRKQYTTKAEWTLEEAQKIFAAMRKIEPAPHYSLATELLSVGGFRRIELFRLTRTEARKNYLTITAKGETRHVPVLAVPGLRELLDRMLALPASPERPDYLFPDDPDSDSWNRLFRRAVRKAGIVPGERTLYCMRKTAIWWMEHTLLWDRQDICDVVGHDRDTDDRFYRKTPSGQELEDRIKRRATTTPSSPNSSPTARSLPVHQRQTARSGSIRARK
ncbi:MAG TPA: hypothetical protein VHI13_05360 [Candidatus Kapabacteria bacterium]|nr:hypothetical protein [Candidatus Kapabacteria bacterium]